MLARAERLHRDFFRPAALPAFEPPADILETEREVLILVALPGVDATKIVSAIEDSALVIEGTRKLPAEFATATIHRLELPQGRFYRRLPLPPRRYSRVQRAELAGCLLIKLEKADRHDG